MTGDTLHTTRTSTAEQENESHRDAWSCAHENFGRLSADLSGVSDDGEFLLPAWENSYSFTGSLVLSHYPLDSAAQLLYPTEPFIIPSTQPIPRSEIPDPP